MNIADIIPALAAWIVTPSPVKIASVKIPPGVDPDFIRDAVNVAGAEPIYVSMHGLAGIDVASAVMSPIAVTFRKKVMVIFDYNAIARSDPTTMTALSAAMKMNKVPFLIVGHVFRGKTDLPKGHVSFEVVADPCRNDDVTVVYRRDKGLTGAEAALSGVVDQKYRGDGIASGGVFDNYLTEPIEAYARVAEAFSAADVIGEQLCRAGDFDDPYTFVPIHAAAMAYHNEGLALKKPIVTFGTLWSKTNAMYAKMNSARAVSRAFLGSGSRVSWGPITGIDMARTMMATALAQGSTDDAIAVARSFGVAGDALLCIMRLWKSKYTLATHAKIKKHL